MPASVSINDMERVFLPELRSRRLFSFLAQVVFRQWLLKSVGMTAFMTLFFTAYVYLLKNPASTVTVMPVTPLDEWIGFHAWSLLLYLSLWFYVSLPPSLLTTRKELFTYGWVIAAVCVAGLACFYFWPTSVPAANIDWARYPGVAFLKGVDAAGNACPSLHVATAVYSAIWLNFLLRRFRVGAWMHCLNWIWCLGILYSTVATRQHVVLDVCAGALLGAVGALLGLRWFVYRNKANSSPASVTKFA